MQKLKRIWNDPVIASVISSLIISIGGWIYEMISLQEIINIYSYATKSISFPFAGVIIPWVLVVTFILVAIKNKIMQKNVLTSKNDIIAVLNEWWPKSKGFPSNITIEFEKIERECKIQQGLVKIYIDEVAKQQGFSCINKGDKFATYEFNMPMPITITY